MSEVEIINLLENNFWSQLVFFIIILVLMVIPVVSLVRNRKNFMTIKIMLLILLLSLGIVSLEKNIAISNAIKNKNWIIENDVVVAEENKHVSRSHNPDIKVTYFENHQSYRDVPKEINVGDSVELLIIPGYFGTDYIMAVNLTEKNNE